MINAISLAATLFAEADPAAGAGNVSPLAQQFLTFAPFLLIIVLFYFMFMRPQKAQENKRKSMLAALKKNDRVWTIGGIYGVVVNVEREDNIAIIKVDETTNTKIRVKLSAVAELVQETAPDTSSK